MQRDIIDVHYSLKLSDHMKLELDATNDNGKQITFINPSASKDFIYFRTILDKDIWISNICMYAKKENDFHMIPADVRCPNIEDLRIFDFQDKVWFVGYMRNATTKIFETYVGYFNSDCTQIDQVVGKIAKEGEHIKNVTPLVASDNQTVWFIDIFTSDVFTYDASKDSIRFSHKLDVEHLIGSTCTFGNDIYGTTQYIHINDTLYGSLVHVTKRIGTFLYYVYLWIEVDISTWKVVFTSKPFVIQKLGLIFVSYIEKCPDDQIQLMFGYEDTHTCRCVTTIGDLRLT